METNPSIDPRFINRNNPSGKRKGKKPLAGVPYISPAALKERYTRLMEEAKARGGKPLLYCPNGDPNVDPTGVRICLGDPAIKTVHWTNFKFPVVTKDDIAHLKLLNHQSGSTTTPPPAAEECPQPSPPKEKRLRSSSSGWSIRKIKPTFSPSFYSLSYEERIPIMKAKLAELAAKSKAEAEALPPRPRIRIWNGMSSQERQEAEALLAASFKPRIRNDMSSSQEPEEAEDAELAAAGIQAQVKGGVSVLEHPLKHLNLAPADSSGI